MFSKKKNTFSGQQRDQLKRLLEEECPQSSQSSKRVKRPLSAEERSRELSLKSRSRLSFARFRSLNEFLYSHSSREAKNHLSRDLFLSYHVAYEQIVKKWPQRPVDCVISRLKTKICETRDLVIGDIGCGNRPLIKEAFPRLSVHSFDLVSTHEEITAADMTSLPLNDSSLDACVFCLSLMAQNLRDVISEANRVTKLNGNLIVVDVTSRFDPNEKLFVSRLKKFGFELSFTQHVTDFFILLEFKKKKAVSQSATLPDVTLKPCVYKLR